MKNEQFELQEAAKRSAETETADCRSGSSRQSAHVRGFLAGATAARPEVVERLLKMAEESSVYSIEFRAAVKAYRDYITPPGRNFSWAAERMLAGERVHHENWGKGRYWARSFREGYEDSNAFFSPRAHEMWDGDKWHSGPKL